MRVLVCDDDPAARFIAKRWLTDTLGCVVTDCEDGVEALAHLADQSFDLALVDLELPRLSGIDVVEAIRGHDTTRDLPVIVVSQERREDVIRTLLALGVSAYLLKPLTERAVVTRIGPLLASLRAEDDGRLGPDTPALLVDGDANFRHAFTSSAGQWGPVLTAASGAEGLAVFRRTPVNLVFVGTGLGLICPDTLARKLREVNAAIRIIGVGLQPGDPGFGQLDGTIGRSFLPDVLAGELAPHVRIGGAPTAPTILPQLRACLGSAVGQVFGMMAGLDAVALDQSGLDETPVVASGITLAVESTFDLDVELVLSRTAAYDVSLLLMGGGDTAVDDETCLATVSELANIVTGRAATWLKGRHLCCRSTLPTTRLAERDEPREAAPPAFTDRFALGDTGQHVVLRAYLRQT